MDLQNSNNSSDSDYIEEEILVYVDIEQTSISEDEIRNAQCLKIITDDKNSVMQINNRFFQGMRSILLSNFSLSDCFYTSIITGNFDYSIGTHVFFEKNEDVTVDPLYSRCDDFHFDFKAKTNKILSMNRVLLKDNSLQDENTGSQGEMMADEENDNDLKITRTYEEALKLFLTPNRNPPRKVNEDDERILLDLINTSQNKECHSNNAKEEIGTLTDAVERTSLQKRIDS